MSICVFQKFPFVTYTETNLPVMRQKLLEFNALLAGTQVNIIDAICITREIVAKKKNCVSFSACFKRPPVGNISKNVGKYW